MIGAKSWHKLMPIYCQLGPQEKKTGEIWIEIRVDKYEHEHIKRKV